MEVLAGREDPEGFFAMCVSVLGHRETSSRFLPLIQPLSTANGALHAALTSIHTDYFSKVSVPHKNHLRGRVSLRFV